MLGGCLTTADLELHGKLGISRELLDRARVRRVTDREARELLSINGKPGDFTGIEYPYLSPNTGRPVHSRVRLDHPPCNADGKPDKKYRSAFGDNRHLYFPPDAEKYLRDTAVPAVLVESEKSALALTAAAGRTGRPLLVIATGGCWAWRGRIGKREDEHGHRIDEKGALPDFNMVTWTGRVSVILFDARPNDSVRAARRALGRTLRESDADVRHGHLPDDDHRVNGPDDLIAASGDDALWRLIDAAMPDDFVRGAAGKILSTNLDNVRLALRRLGVILRFDEFSRRVLVDGVELDDALLDDLWISIDDEFRFRPTQALLRTVLTVEARRHRVHPVCEYLDALVWDGERRLDDWLPRYGGAEATPYVSAVGALSLIAAVRRIRRPGCKFDELLILESALQGTLKSSALRTLCPVDSWFSDDLPLGVTAKELIERTRGKWLIEAAEMHGHRGREVDQLKAFLSRQVDGPVRLAYDRFSSEVPRQFVIIGTTNATAAYLKDATGGRRFWPVRVNSFDLDALRRDRDQLWAEAALREAQGETIRLGASLWGLAAEQQEQRRAADPWEDVLESLLGGKRVVAVEDIWNRLGIEACHQDNRHADRVAQILQRHGFTHKKRIRIDARPVRCWIRDDSGDPSTDPTDQ